MLTALICVSGLALLEAYIIVVLGIWARLVNKENKDLSEPVLPIWFDGED